ncbi:undecaprenyl-phosphate glucose phosphotransferase [Xanthobacter dioxanivorans]|uniref:Undecaprenyl-phosphate glucose phosphotransferase n=1 Tax=Xanthobacter dioxanivorans TaxID=2528964 RepID=A0A974PL82_9HYPH|nr:undecaprenyl-phosphate glucose phosphotransferase [Xanthobacter dioxanivorans]QRG05075.1 undecaprenyl-phosphate glucose phosphotransferase [Xanthobacter dioxanivorans]
MSLSTDNIQVKRAGEAVARKGSGSLDYSSIAPLFVLYDVAIILGLCVLVSFFTSERGDIAFEYTHPIGIGILAAVAFVLTTSSRGLYKPWRMVRIVEQTTAAVVNWIFAMLVVAAVIFCLKVGVSTSRLSTGILAVSGLVALPASRWAMAAWLRRAAATGAVRGRPTILIGDPSELEQVVPAHLLVRLGLKETRRFSLSAPNETETGALDASDADTLKSALQFARQNRIEEILLAMPWSNIERLEAVRSRLRALPIPVKLLPDEAVSELLDAPRVDFGASIAIEVQRAPLSRLELAQKRALDISVASVALTLLLPLFLVLAVAIKLDSRGPVIFRQRRNGFGGREFTIYKFRSMTVMEDGSKVVQAQRNDKRVTRIGRFLRASSLDELPQVLNVLFGHMSIVGPRPHAIAHDDAYSKLIAGYAFRHHVKPGITGWAQVQGLRGETAELEQMARRIEMDLWYINNWSILIDIKIILKTFIEVLRKDAY